MVKVPDGSLVSMCGWVGGCVCACVHVCPVHLRALAYTSTTPTLQRKHHAHLHTPTHTHPYTLPCVQEPLEVVVKDKPGAVTTALWSLLEIMSDPSKRVALAPRTLFNSLRAKLVGTGTYVHIKEVQGHTHFSSVAFYVCAYCSFSNITPTNQ